MLRLQSKYFTGEKRFYKILFSQTGLFVIYVKESKFAAGQDSYVPGCIASLTVPCVALLYCSNSIQHIKKLNRVIKYKSATQGTMTSEPKAGTIKTQKREIRN
jgi:hypothetical protein